MIFLRSKHNTIFLLSPKKLHISRLFLASRRFSPLLRQEPCHQHLLSRVIVYTLLAHSEYALYFKKPVFALFSPVLKPLERVIGIPHSRAATRHGGFLCFSTNYVSPRSFGINNCTNVDSYRLGREFDSIFSIQRAFGLDARITFTKPFQAVFFFSNDYFLPSAVAVTAAVRTRCGRTSRTIIGFVFFFDIQPRIQVLLPARWVFVVLVRPRV